MCKRAVGRSENPGEPVLFGGHNLSPLVEIGLTDLPKSGVAMAGTPGTPRDDRPALPKAHKSHRAVSNVVEGYEEKVRSVAFPLWRLSHNTSTIRRAREAVATSCLCATNLTLQESRYKSPLLCWPRLICIQTRPVRYLAAKTIANGYSRTTGMVLSWAQQLASATYCEVVALSFSVLASGTRVCTNQPWYYYILYRENGK